MNDAARGVMDGASWITGREVAIAVIVAFIVITVVLVLGSLLDDKDRHPPDPDFNSWD